MFDWRTGHQESGCSSLKEQKGFQYRLRKGSLKCETLYIAEGGAITEKLARTIR